MSIALPHQARVESSTDSWITPAWLIERLGPFDMDPCSCDPQPWPTAARMLKEVDDGLLAPWHGFVWLNPPYSRRWIGAWLNRMALHNNGIALVFARTDTAAFHDNIFFCASSLLFIRGRLTFCTPDGEAAPAGHNSGGPSVLVGYGRLADERLKACADLGAYFPNPNRKSL